MLFRRFAGTPPKTHHPSGKLLVTTALAPTTVWGAKNHAWQNDNVCAQPAMITQLDALWLGVDIWVQKIVVSCDQCAASSYPHASSKFYSSIAKSLKIRRALKVVYVINMEINVPSAASLSRHRPGYPPANTAKELCEHTIERPPPTRRPGVFKPFSPQILSVICKTTEQLGN